ncbi:hypothetical protein DK926_13260 [Rhodococcus sp. Eu-32]|uniref:SCO6745 family protein n=1 Tax=Rhodococcus sp. Eu-32 TaxID=1017319 RepID=UPI000DF24F7E|nr:hypothetical protein [Rhodococcus sp. Eu-32]RRQ27448.1 hypothetical protein DK926_13260 [Rhodococcus sp. Eu-32]
MSLTEIARAAYTTLEPFHVSAYFNPQVREAGDELGLDGHAWYVGARAAPMGETAASVVAAAFYNFNPSMIEKAWPAAVGAGLDRVSDRRWAMLDSVLGDALGSRTGDSELVEVAKRLRHIGDTAVFAGRPLAAAWHSATAPDAPHLALWHAITVIREWRGDGHIAALVDAQLDPTEAVVFHEAFHPEPKARRVLGKRITQLTRQWSDEEWDAAFDRLATRNLLMRTDAGEALTDDGVALDAHIEARTDALASGIWRDVPDAEDLIIRVRPYVKAVIDAGILPGTKKR